ncbi:hypothetical protein SteCoe_29513 [Stentor coeruleus]|uniref:Uncharacterized protein n=1 Tax=Stentor coeruleus TaxID=5963 RepID=A0A1R2B5U1_9CILI|nr:hypothetical protein SteCoe_29513 [Stentor coeruleus]
MEPSYFQRSDYLNSRVKHILIESLIKRECLDSSFSHSSYRGEEISFDKSCTSDLNSSEILSVIPPLIKSENPSRPSSSCSTKSSNLQAYKYQDSSIPDSYFTSINNISLKTIKAYEKAQNSGNLECLLYSFLIIFTGIKRNADVLHSVVLMRNKAFSIFKGFLSVPGNFIKSLRGIPRIIRQKRLSLNDLKKSLAWFNMSSMENLGIYASLYEFVKETLAYSRKFYCVPIVFDENKTPLSVKDNKGPNKVEKNHFYAKNTQKNTEVSIVFTESADEDSENTLRPTHARKKSLKNPKMCSYTSKFKDKNNSFLMNSRIVQKSKDAFTKYWQGNKNKYTSITENKLKQVFDVFQDFQNYIGHEITGEGAKIIQQDIAVKLSE